MKNRFRTSLSIAAFLLAVFCTAEVILRIAHVEFPIPASVGRLDSPFLINPYYGESARRAYFTPLKEGDDLGRSFGAGPVSPWFRKNFVVNSFGFLSSELQETTPHFDKQDLVVGIFGGSSAANLYLQTGDILSESLQKKFPTRHIRLLNFSAQGFKQPQSLNVLNFALLRGVRFDFVVNIDGTGEVASAALNGQEGYNPILPLKDVYSYLFLLLEPGETKFAPLAKFKSALREQQLWLGIVDKRPLRQSRVVQALTHLVLQSFSRNIVDAGRELRASNRFKEQSSPFYFLPSACGDACTAESIRIWSQASRMMRLSAQQFGARYIHVIPPNVHVPGAKKEPTAEEAKIFAQDLEQYAPSLQPIRRLVPVLYPELQKEVETLKRAGEEIYDTSFLFKDSKETIFIDACCHISQYGNKALAEFIAKKF